MIGHAVSPRARLRRSGTAGRRGRRRGSVATRQHRADAERRQGDRALDDIAAGHRRRSSRAFAHRRQCMSTNAIRAKGPGGGSYELSAPWERAGRSPDAAPSRLVTATGASRMAEGGLQPHRCRATSVLGCLAPSVDARPSTRRAAAAYWSRAGIGSASAARPAGASKGSAKYWVSWVTRPSVISMTLTEHVGTPS